MKLEEMALRQTLHMKFKAFIDECEQKMLLRAKQHDRSLEPWKDYDTQFLLRRLVEETEELDELISVDDWKGVTGFTDNKAAQDELKDIANFCFMIWTKLEDEK